MTASESVLNDLPAEKTRRPSYSNMHRPFNSSAKGQPQLLSQLLLRRGGWDAPPAFPTRLIRNSGINPGMICGAS
jgi:hypothetical protein